jgi:hypothetical protein
MAYSDGDIVMWIRNRLVTQYGESPGVDFVDRLAEIAEKLGTTLEVAELDGEPYYMTFPREHIIDGGAFVYVMKSKLPEHYPKKRKGK